VGFEAEEEILRMSDLFLTRSFTPPLAASSTPVDEKDPPSS